MKNNPILLEEEEALFQSWFCDTGFDDDYMDEKCARRIWYAAYSSGYDACKKRIREVMENS